MSRMTCEGCPVGESHCGGLRHGNCASIKASYSGPGLLSMAGSFAKAVVTHVADDGRIAPPDVQAERKRICFACDEHHDHERDRCRKCGCIAMNLKRSWASEACPDTPPRWESLPCPRQ